MLNEATIIFLIDCIILFTDVMNTGNMDDLNGGNTPDIKQSRQYSGLIYIAFFAGNIIIHLAILAWDHIKLCKSKCKGKYRLRKWQYEREKSF